MNPQSNSISLSEEALISSRWCLWLPLAVTVGTGLAGVLNLVILTSLGIIAQPGWLAGVLIIGLPALTAGAGSAVFVWNSAKTTRSLLRHLAYQDLLMKIHDESMVALDMKGRILHWNQAAENLYGYSAAAVLGQPFDQVVPIHGQKPFPALLQQVSHMGSWKGTFQTQRIDASPLWIEAAVTVVRDARGQPSALVAIGHDVTEKMATERTLQEVQLRYRSMFAGSRAAMLLIDPETGRLVDANQAAVDFYGYSKEKLLEMKITEINTLVHDQVFDQMHQAKRQTKNYFQFQHRLASGEIRCVEVYSSPVQIGGKTLLYSIIHDATERQQAEKALQESEQRLREMLENIRLAAVTLNLEQRVTFCNEFFSNITDWTQQEIIGQLWMERFVPEEERPERQAVLDALMKGNQVAYHLEREILTRTGDRRLISWDLFPLYADGQVMGVAGIGEDITEHRQMERDMARRARELAALQKTGHFITSAQNLGEALAGIAAAARLLLGSQSAVILLHDAQQRQLEYAAVDGKPAEGDFHQVGDRIADDEGAAGWVLKRGQPLLADSLQNEPDFSQSPGADSGVLVAVPLMYQQETMGVLSVHNSSLGAISENHKLILSTLADLATMAVVTHRLVQAEHEQRLQVERSQAHADPE
jgi:PAS domain S-box-containing protein